MENIGNLYIQFNLPQLIRENGVKIEVGRNIQHSLFEAKSNRKEEEAQSPRNPILNCLRWKLQEKGECLPPSSLRIQFIEV